MRLKAMDANVAKAKDAVVGWRSRSFEVGGTTEVTPRARAFAPAGLRAGVHAAGGFKDDAMTCMVRRKVTQTPLVGVYVLLGGEMYY